jgi:hypothetical protein
MYYVGCMVLKTGFYIMSCLTFRAKPLLYRHYVFVLDLFHILWCQPVLGFMEHKQIQFNSVGIPMIHNQTE